MPYTIKSINQPEAEVQTNIPIQNTQQEPLPQEDYVNEPIEGQKQEARHPLQENKKYTIKSVPEKEQTPLESAGRYAFQVVKPVALRLSRTPGMAAEAAKVVSSASEPTISHEGFLGSDEITNLKERMKQRFPDVDEKQIESDIREGYKKVSENFPSLSTLFEKAEKAGIPTEAKSSKQKGLSVVADVATFAQNPIAAVTSGLTALGLYEGMQNQGVSEENSGIISRIVGLLLGHGWGEQTKLPVAEEKEYLPDILTPGEPPPSGPRPTGISEFTSKVRKGALETEKKPVEKLGEQLTRREQPSGKRPENVSQITPGRENEIAQDIFNPDDPPPPPPGSGQRQLPVRLSTQTREAEGRNIPVSTAHEGDEISRVASRELGINPEAVTPQQRQEMQRNLRNEGLKVSQQPKNENQLDRVTHSVTPISVGNKEVAGFGLKRVFNQLERNTFVESNRLYDNARELTDQIVDDFSEMVPELENIHREHINSSDPVMADIAREADKLINEVTESGHPTPISMSRLIRRIQELRSGAKHKFANDPQNAYSILTDVIENQLDRARGLSGDALQAWRDARNFYRENYAPVFKNPESFNLLNEKYIHYEDLFDKLTKPSIYNFLEPQLRQNPSGVRLLDAAKREILSKKLDPLFKTENVTRSQLQDALDDIGINVNRAERNRMYEQLEGINREKIRVKEQADILSKRNITPIEKPKAPEVEEKIPLSKKKVSDIKSESWWKNASEKQIETKIDSIKGMEDLKKQLSNNKELFEDIKRTAGIRRITNKKAPSESTHETVKKMLENQDDLEFLNYSLGRKTVSEFRNRVEAYDFYKKQVDTYEKNLKQLEQAKKTKSNIDLKKEQQKDLTTALIELGKKEITLDAIELIPGANYIPRSIKNEVVNRLFQETEK